ncbi:discoidin domain-containing protein [Cetobacterium sp.]|uniref:discoidin domain-containing protein n=1 Tax=Cetobacterium sp. TaxID=2071632 RepID=UPI003F347150
MRTTSNNRNVCLVFTIETNVKNVINKLELLTLAHISNAEILYTDEHGYDKVSKLLEVKNIDNKTELLFEAFYAKKFDLVIYDEVSEEEIEKINIISIDQHQFYEEKDVDVRLDKKIMLATSLCGQNSNESPNLAIDGNRSTRFHSAKYSGGYADFLLNLGDEFLISGLEFITRANNDGTGNGRIKSYEIMYKSSTAEEWKKIFQQLTEEAGETRTATFKPVLATEICIRVTNGKNGYIAINEIDIFKYSLIEEKISNLFTNSLEEKLKDEVTIEEIEALESQLVTKSYLDRITNAKKLYLKRMFRKVFQIELSENKKFDKVYFTSEEVVASAELEYIDKDGIEVLIQAEVSNSGNNYTLNIDRISTSKASIILYGTDKITDIETNRYIAKDTILVKSSVSTYSTNYPELMLDEDESTYFHSNKYNSGTYGDVYISLNSPEVISKLEFKTDHPIASNGQIQQYDILYKESKEVPIWKELYTSNIDTSPGWKLAEFPAVYAAEICIRVNQSYGNWILINELNICSNKSELEKYLEKVYSDKTCTTVKSDVKLRDIKKLTEIYSDSILGAKAKMLWLTDNNLEVSNFKLLEVDKKYENLEEILRIQECIDLVSTSYKLLEKTDYLIESNKDIKLCVISQSAETPIENIIELKSGINEIYSKNISGDIFVLREDTKEVSLSLYNVKKSTTHYKIGEYTINELFRKNNPEEYITLEGKNFIIRGKIKWILENCDIHNVVDGIVNLDYILDYLWLLIDRNEYHTTDYRVTNLKRIFWQSSTGKVASKYTHHGSYIEFKNDFGFLLQDKMKNLVKEEISEVLAEQMISKDLYGPSVCSFIKTIIKKIMILKSNDVVEMPTTSLEALATKLFLFSNNDRMITYIYKNLTKEELGQNNSVILNKICLWITKYLQRDISTYFLALGLELNEEILKECNSYIEPTININNITFENYKELVKEELEKFNLNYTSLVNGNGGDTSAK